MVSLRVLTSDIYAFFGTLRTCITECGRLSKRNAGDERSINRCFSARETPNDKYFAVRTTTRTGVTEGAMQGGMSAGPPGLFTTGFMCY